jgi:hypothetical protein
VSGEHLNALRARTRAYDTELSLPCA